MFVPPTRLDECSSSSSSEDLEGYEFDGLDDASNNTQIKWLSKTDLSNVLEENKEENEERLNKNKADNDHAFAFSSGYSMKTVVEDSNEPSPFKKGYKMTHNEK